MIVTMKARRKFIEEVSFEKVRTHNQKAIALENDLMTYSYQKWQYIVATVKEMVHDLDGSGSDAHTRNLSIKMKEMNGLTNHVASLEKLLLLSIEESRIFAWVHEKVVPKILCEF